jgi:hypothetical protein
MSIESHVDGETWNTTGNYLQNNMQTAYDVILLVSDYKIT